MTPQSIGFGITRAAKGGSLLKYERRQEIGNQIRHGRLRSLDGGGGD